MMPRRDGPHPTPGGVPGTRRSAGGSKGASRLEKTVLGGDGASAARCA